MFEGLIIGFCCIFIAANGSCQADEGNARIPKTVSTNGYDGTQLPAIT
jgi:hypothetical protein